MMNKMTKLFLALMVLTLTFGVEQNAYAAGTQRVMIENFTGTWCPWCPGGKQEAEDCVKRFGADKIIPVAVHVNDPMATTYEPKISSFYGFSGAPIGLLNREPIPQYNSAGQLIRSVIVIPSYGGIPYSNQGGYWGNVSDVLLKNNPSADVDVTYFIDKTTRVLTVNVKASILKDIKSQTAFNALYVENNVKAPSPRPQNWYQQNAFPTNSKLSSHPYFNQPRTIAMDYQTVLRDYIGGAFGDTTAIPASVKAGETYEKVFSKVIPTTVNIDNIKVIGYYSNYDMSNNLNNSIINVNYGTAITPTVSVVGNGPSVFVAPVSTGTSKDWVCANLTNAPVDFKIEIVKSARTPSDWKIEVEKPILTVAGGSSANCKVIITPGTTWGLGDATVKITPTMGNPYYFKLTAASKEIERLVVNYAPPSDDSDIMPILNSLDGYKDFIAINGEESKSLLTMFSNLKVVVANTGTHLGLGEFGGNLNDTRIEANNLASIYNTKKVRLFITGSLIFHNTYLNNSSNNLGTLYGISIDKTDGAGNKNILYNVQNFDISGVPNDPISKGFRSTGMTRYKIAPLTVTRLASSNATKFLNIDNQVEGCIGMRFENGLGTRTALLNQNLYAYTNVTKRLDLTKRIMDWLTFGLTSAPAPTAVLSATKLDFGKDVKPGTAVEKSLLVTNSGSADLKINKPTLLFEGLNYKLSDANVYPLTIAAGSNATIKVTWTPNEFGKTDDNSLKITTNDLKNPEFNVSLTGQSAAESIAPVVTTSTSKIDFGTDKEANKSYDMVLNVSNTGNADLTIQKPVMQFTDSDFKFTDGNSYPIILQKSASTTMKVTWTPKLANKLYKESFTFATNDPVKPEVTVSLEGKTAPISSVEDGTIGVFTAKLNNNPIVDNTTVNFVVGGSSEQNVSIKLIDASGAIVATLANANYLPGTYSVNLSTANLASGTYFVLANAAGVQAKLTAVVVK